MREEEKTPAHWSDFRSYALAIRPRRSLLLKKDRLATLRTVSEV